MLSEDGPSADAVLRLRRWARRETELLYDSEEKGGDFWVSRADYRMRLISGDRGLESKSDVLGASRALGRAGLAY